MAVCPVDGCAAEGTVALDRPPKDAPAGWRPAWLLCPDCLAGIVGHGPWVVAAVWDDARLVGFRRRRRCAEGC